MSDEFSLQHQGITIRYRLTRGRNRHGIVSLRVRQDGLVLACVPPRVSVASVHQLVRDKADWLVQYLATPTDAPAQTCRYEDGAWHLLLGNRHTLRLHTGSRMQQGVRLQDNELHICLTEHSPATTARSLYRYYAEVLSTQIHHELADLLPGMPWVNTPPPFTLKRLRSRWGSCSSQGHLNFNLHLAKAPPQVIRYVVLHELCHLAEMNHSPRFWQLVEARMPDWRQHRQWFREHGPQLLHS